MRMWEDFGKMSAGSRDDVGRMSEGCWEESGVCWEDAGGCQKDVGGC